MGRVREIALAFRIGSYADKAAWDSFFTEEKKQSKEINRYSDLHVVPKKKGKKRKK